MKEYTLYFQINNKKLRTSVIANSEEQAKNIIRDKIIFHKVTAKDIKGDTLQKIKDLFGDIFK